MLTHEKIMKSVFVQTGDGSVFNVLEKNQATLVFTKDSVDEKHYNLIGSSLFLYRALHCQEECLKLLINFSKMENNHAHSKCFKEMIEASEFARSISLKGIRKGFAKEEESNVVCFLEAKKGIFP